MKSTVFSVITLVVALFFALPASGSQKIGFSIIYTNDVMGEVDPCG